MKNMIRLLLAVGIGIAANPLIAQDGNELNFDRIVGVWSISYEDGQTGTFTMSKEDDGAPRIKVTTGQGGESEARDIQIEGDTIAFSRDVNMERETFSVNYQARLVNGKLEGTGKVVLNSAFAGAAGGATVPFTATRAE